MLIDFRELFPKYNIQPKGILHIGANVGEEAPVYLELGYPNQLWIEANPNIYHKLVTNISSNPHAHALNYCVSDKRERVIFNISNNASQSSSILELGTHKQMHPDVRYVDSLEMEAFPMDEILMANHYRNPSTGQYEGIDYDFLNIDLQGAELKALKGMGKFMDQIKWIYLEVNFDHVYEGCALLPEIDEYLGALGFKRVELKWASQNLTWGDALFIK